MSTSESYGIITEDNLWAAPMENCHKELVARHYYRISHILYERDEAGIDQYTNKQAAREQLARMTLVIRDYMAMHKRAVESGEDPDAAIESMVADVVDASCFVQGPLGAFAQPMFVNSQLWGREQEIATLMQELSAGIVDDVIELWNLESQSTDKVVPDSSAVDDLGKDIDWNNVLCRSRSEANILHHYGDFVIEDLERWREDLAKRELEELDLVWPPVFKDPEPNVGRQRRRTNTMTRV